MGLDALSPIAPARVKALLVPVGQIKSSRFADFIHRLRQENVVRLGDVSPDGRPHRTMFSPLAFPDGLVLYDLCTSLPPPSHLQLAPLEIYRLPLLIIGIADGLNLPSDGAEDTLNNGSVGDTDAVTSDLDGLSESLNRLKKEHAAALVHRILIFDHVGTISTLSGDIASVPPLAKSRTTTIKTIMCDMTSLLLAEMTTYAKSMQGLSTIPTPRTSTDATVNGAISAVPAYMAGTSRPNSATDRSRSYSPAGGATPGHRMSMPVNISSIIEARGSSPDGRAAPPALATHVPSGTFEGANDNGSNRSPPRAVSRDRMRPGSEDRISTSGFGPGSIGERERNRGKARIGVVVGALYLLAGRWPDAIRELAQSATVAGANSDYVWQAKATEYLLVCLLASAWAGMDFNIPDVLLPTTNRLSTGASKASKHSPSNSQHDVTLSSSVDPVKRNGTLQSLANLLPGLTNNMLNLYGRAWTFTEDKIPPIAVFHSTIRFAKLLTALNTSQGRMDDDVLRHLVMDTTLSHSSNSPSDTTSFSSKPDIVTLLFRAYPNSSWKSSLSMSDNIAMLAAIAAVLSELGYHRKRALVFKDIILALLPALVQARKDGAAEMGVHPAASLASLHAPVRSSMAVPSTHRTNSPESGMEAFLSLVCRTFGIRFQHRDLKIEKAATNQQNNSSASLKNPLSSAFRIAIYNAYGAHDLKIDILRSCINICEALPDLSGAIEYSALLLSAAGSGIAPQPESSDGSPSLDIEEQLRLATNTSRTLSAAQNLGLRYQEPEYWDEFLIRGIDVVEIDQMNSLTAHAKSELELVDTVHRKKEKNPFIYNPFLTSKASLTSETILVAEEEAVFQVMLQNLYDFDITIESIVLTSDGPELSCAPQSSSIGPYRTQAVLITAIPQNHGTLIITGCKVKIRGCCERMFSIFKQPWTLKADVKGRNLQILDPKKRLESLASDNLSGKSNPDWTLNGPKPTSLVLKVIESQPTVTVKSSSLAQSAIMLLSGEKKAFRLTLQNHSSIKVVDLLFLSFTDSTQVLLQEALASKELSAIGLYDLELSSARKPAFHWDKADDDNVNQILPNGHTILSIEVFGRHDLTYGTVQVDFGYLGFPKSDVVEPFYTRQIFIPITVTVSASIHLIRHEILPLVPEFRREIPNASGAVYEGSSNDDRFNESVPRRHKLEPELVALLGSGDLFDSPSPYCLLLLDFHNSWSSTLTLTLRVSASASSANSKSLYFNYTMHPSTSIRIPLPIPRVFLPSSKANSPIPILSNVNKRQFVVSATKTSPHSERRARQSFWYREEILKYVSATWKEESTCRSGSVELDNLKLSPAMVETYKLDDLDIRMSVGLSGSTVGEEAKVIHKVAHGRFRAPTSTFLSLRTRLYNRSSSPIRPLLRLQPALMNQPDDIALDLSKKLLVNGVLQRRLEILGPGEERTQETGFLVLCQGVYQWGAIVEDICAPTITPAKDRPGRNRAATGDLDLQVDNEERRIWAAETPCVVIAEGGVDEESDRKGSPDTH